MSSAFIWLIAGIVFLALEAFGASGIGFFFAGLAALCVGVLVQTGVAAEGSYLAQFAWFFGLTVVWAIALWRPIAAFKLGRKGKPAQAYNNIIGEVAVVGGDGLELGSAGQVHWSGTLMRAELSPEAGVSSLPAGTQVIIADLKGATLIVTPK